MTPSPATGDACRTLCRRGLLLIASICSAGALSAAALLAAEVPVDQPASLDPQTRVLDTSRLSGLGSLLDQLTARRLVFIGESHDRYEDHLLQLAVIRGLHERGRPLAIGLEMFQQPYQSVIDAYLAGAIDEAAFLKDTQYFERWRYDYRLYQPILRYAREAGIPVVALNLEAELTRRVGDVGIAGLEEAERARIPAEIDRGDADYRARLEAVFAMHPAEQKANFEHFLEVQLVWDEGMADRAARYLVANPERTMVVLAGSGHVEYGRGIPRRLLRRLDTASTILLNGTDRVPDPLAADFFVYPEAVQLPPAGMLGVMLDAESPGTGVRVEGFGDQSGARDAGMEVGDRITAIDGRPIADYTDIRIALLGARPGQRLPLEVQRGRLMGGPEPLTLDVELR